MAVMNPNTHVVQLTWFEIKAILIARGIKKSTLARLDYGYFMRSIAKLAPAMKMIRLQKYKRTGKWS